MTQLSKIQVLYVDDEPQSLKYFSKLFQDRFDIATAETADDAIRYLGQHWERVGVLLTDQRMPGKTGVQLMEFVRARYPNIVRILITAFSDLDSAVQAVNEGGAFRYLTKPINEQELVGALLRGFDFHQAMVDRDRLMREKLSVLHRLIVMDRIRGLATAATALEGRLRHAWKALVAYIQQSPVRQRLNLQMDEIANLNMVSIAKREAELMVRTVEMILRDTIDASSGFEAGIGLRKTVESYVARESQAFREDDVELIFDNAIEEMLVSSDRGLLDKLLQILVHRLADLQEHPAKITIKLQLSADHCELIARGSFGELSNANIASLFAAAIPLHKWPIGLDMDLLSAFLIAHHLGGALTVEPKTPQGPGFRLRLPQDAMSVPSTRQRDPAWFDSVYESLEQWGQELDGDEDFLDRQ